MRCLVIRHAALGDGLQASCILPYLHRDGYEIDFLANERCRNVLENNPYISKFINHEDHWDEDDDESLGDYWDRMGEGYDKVVNCTGIVENEMLFVYPSDEYFLTMRQRRKLVEGKNYYDQHLKRAGYEPDKDNPPKMEIYFSKEEKRRGKWWKKRHKNEFKIMWSLTGSSNHKVYRYFEPLAREFLDTHGDAYIYTNGDYASKLLTFQHPRVKNLMFMEDFSFRDAMLLTKQCDLVIGPETGLLMAAGAWKIPKILLLSHSGPEQVTKYWDNVYPLLAPCWCSPCYILWKYKYIWQHICQIDDTIQENGRSNYYPDFATPKCTEHGQDDIKQIMEKIYVDWKKIRS